MDTLLGMAVGIGLSAILAPLVCLALIARPLLHLDHLQGGSVRRQADERGIGL